MIASVPLLLTMGMLCQSRLEVTPPVAVNWLTGPKFRQEIEQPFSGNWSNIAFRPLLQGIAADRQIAIILDRRVDPSVELPLDAANVSLKTGLISPAKQAGCDATVPGNLVFLGPKSATTRLRTLIELRRQELQASEFSIPRKRRTELLQPRRFSSNDLDSPREILNRFAEQGGLRVANPDLIPHDLWAAMVLPEVSVVEGLSIVLIQFDMTFRWTNEGNGVELVSIPDEIFIERKHSTRRKVADALAAIRERWPRLQAEISGNQLVVRGLIEDHDAVAVLLRGDGTSSPIKIEPPQPLRKQLFTLKAIRTPLSGLMKTLEESAVSFEFDADELAAAGIRLDQTIDVDVKKVSAEEFFHSVFDPAGLDFQIDHLTVKLTPKNRKSK